MLNTLNFSTGFLFKWLGFLFFFVFKKVKTHNVVEEMPSLVYQLQNVVEDPLESVHVEM